MAHTTLSDIYERVPFDEGFLEASLEKSALFTSNALQLSPDLAEKVGSNDGRAFDTYFNLDLVDNEPDIMDDSGTDIVPDSIGYANFRVRKNMRAKAWGQKEIVKLVGAMTDPLDAMRSRTAAWWGRWYDRVAISTVNGVIGDNIANDSGDMVVNVWTNAAPSNGTNTVDQDVIIDAQATMGDRMDEPDTIVMHSKVKANLEKQNAITTVRDSDGTMFSYYREMRVLVSDRAYESDGTLLTGIGSATNSAYATYLFASGVLGFGASNNDLIPSEIDYDGKKGKGAGQTMLITRSQFALHPPGFTFTEASVAGESATRAELEAAANWNRTAADRKAVKMAVIFSRL